MIILLQVLLFDTQNGQKKYIKVNISDIFTKKYYTMNKFLLNQHLFFQYIDHSGKFGRICCDLEEMLTVTSNSTIKEVFEFSTSEADELISSASVQLVKSSHSLQSGAYTVLPNICRPCVDTILITILISNSNKRF